jgi:hypothetical protein
MSGQFLGRAAIERAGRLLHIAARDLAGLYRATVLSLIGNRRRSRRARPRRRLGEVPSSLSLPLHTCLQKQVTGAKCWRATLDQDGHYSFAVSL